jgi:rubrerythrin
MKSVKGTKTEQNLLKAFAGESQARNRYTMAASGAKKAGYEQIAAIFQESADNELEHAKLFWKFLEDGEIEITAGYPTSRGDVAENLKLAAGGEHCEWTEIYPTFAKIADEEGFDKIAEQFRSIAAVEEEHEKRFRTVLSSLEAGSVFKKGQPVRWKCRNCGRIIEGTEAPGVCPTCYHKQAFFEVVVVNY